MGTHRWSMDNVADLVEWQDFDSNILHCGVITVFGHPFGTRYLAVLPLFEPLSRSPLRTVQQIESDAKYFKNISCQ